MMLVLKLKTFGIKLKTKLKMHGMLQKIKQKNGRERQKTNMTNLGVIHMIL